MTSMVSRETMFSVTSYLFATMEMFYCESHDDQVFLEPGSVLRELSAQDEVFLERSSDIRIHRAVLEVWKLWWCCLLRDSTTNVILLPGVSMLEVEKFVGKIYGEFNFSPNDDENDTFHGFTEAEIDIAASIV